MLADFILKDLLSLKDLKTFFNFESRYLSRIGNVQGSNASNSVRMWFCAEIFIKFSCAENLLITEMSQHFWWESFVINFLPS